MLSLIISQEIIRQNHNEVPIHTSQIHWNDRQHLVCIEEGSTHWYTHTVTFFWQYLLITKADMYLPSVQLTGVWLFVTPMDCSTPGLPVPHHLLEFAQVHVHCIGDAIQSSHPLMPFSPSALNLFCHQGLFQWVGCSHQVAKILKLQIQHQSFQWVFRVDFP